VVSSEVLAGRLSTPAASSLGKSATSGVLWTTLHSLGGRLGGTVVFLVLARLLVPREFGLLAIAQVFVSLCSTLTDAGFTRTLVQRPKLRAAHLDSALLVSVGLGMVMSLGLVLGAPLVAVAYHQPQLRPVLTALAVVPLVGGITGVPESMMRRQLRFRALALREMSSVVLSGAIGIVLAFLGAGVWALVGQVVSQAIIAVVVLWVSVGWRPSANWTLEAVRELMGFGSHMLGITLLNFLNARSGQLLIGLFLGPGAVGLYAVAVRVLNLSVDVMINNVQKVAFPVFSRIADQPRRMANAYLRAIEVTTTVSFVGYGLLALLAPQMTRLVFGAKWEAAGPLMALLALTGPATSIAFFSNGVMLAAGQSAMALRWTTARTAFTVVVMLATVHFGLQVMAIGLVVRNWAALPVSMSLVRRVTGVSLRAQAKTMLVPTAAVASMAMVVTAFLRVTDLEPPAELLTALPLGILTYMAVALPLRRDLILGAFARVRPRDDAKRTA
jgi:O-antigen/teichoic acid export membrane protein